MSVRQRLPLLCCLCSLLTVLEAVDTADQAQPMREAERWLTVELLTLASVLQDGVPVYDDAAAMAAGDAAVVLPQHSVVTLVEPLQDAQGSVIAMRVSVPWNERFRIGLIDCNSIRLRESVLLPRHCAP